MHSHAHTHMHVCTQHTLHECSKCQDLGGINAFSILFGGCIVKTRLSYIGSYSLGRGVADWKGVMHAWSCG